jgi:hypothetical protein
MSINALANAAAARRSDIPPLDTVPKGLAEIARAAATPPTAEGIPSARAGPGETAAQIDTAFNVLFGYIPTEILTLYVAVLAAVHEEKITAADWIAFWSFLVATPIVVWLVYAAKVKAAGKALPLEFAAWPVWEMFAGTVAFCAWAFALPNAPFSEYPWHSSALSGVAVLVGSTVLGLLSPFFQNPLTPRST